MNVMNNIARQGRLALLENDSATGDPVVWGGGIGSFTAEGTFNGTTVYLEYESPSGNWISAGSESELTAEGGFVFELHPCRIRAAVSGGSPSALYAWVQPTGG